jgi:hypothetical protein
MAYAQTLRLSMRWWEIVAISHNWSNSTQPQRLRSSFILLLSMCVLAGAFITVHSNDETGVLSPQDFGKLSFMEYDLGYIDLEKKTLQDTRSFHAQIRDNPER